MPKIFQNFHTGLWGFGTWAGCPNLTSCAFRTENDARKALEIDARVGALLTAGCHPDSLEIWELQQDYRSLQVANG